ncbi:MAG: sensor domain-containing diguanylate cyclase [Oscillospiraceae bacterium]
MKHLKKQRFTVVSIFIGVIAIVFLLEMFNRNVDKSVEYEMRSYLNEIRNNAIYMLNREVSGFSASLQNEARTINLLGELSDEELLNELHDFPKNRSMLCAVAFFVDGRILCGYDKSIPQYDPTKFEATLTGRTTAIGAPRFSNTFHRPVVDISTPLCISGEHKGVLSASYDIAAFNNLFSGNFLRGDCAICISTSTGDLISRSGTAPLPPNAAPNIFSFYHTNNVNFLESSLRQVETNMSAGKAGYFAYEADGIPRLVSYAPVGINDWYVAAVTTSKSLSDHANTIKIYALRLVAGLFVVMLIMATVVLLTRANEQRSTRKFLKKMAQTDLLTSLLNKSATEHEITAFLKSCSTDGTHALFMLDIDGFKRVNDRLGHLKGDEILADVGSALRSIFGESAILGRVGGDEFVVFIKNCTDLTELTASANQICAALHRTYCVEGSPEKSAKISASIGIALYPTDGTCFDELYHSADTALYASKNAGRDRHSFFQTPAAHTSTVDSISER